MSDQEQPPSDDSSAPAPADPAGAPSAEAPPAAWQPLAMTGLRERLAEVKRLLEQAAALAAARDTSRIETMTSLIQKNEEQARGGAARRRYR